MPNLPPVRRRRRNRTVVDEEPKPSLSEEEVINIPMRDRYSSELRISNRPALLPAKGSARHPHVRRRLHGRQQTRARAHESNLVQCTAPP